MTMPRTPLIDESAAGSSGKHWMLQQSFVEKVILLVLDKLLFALLVGIALLLGKALFDEVNRTRDAAVAYAQVVAERRLAATENMWRSIFKFRSSVDGVISGAKSPISVDESVAFMNQKIEEYGLYFGDEWVNRMQTEVVLPVKTMSSLAGNVAANEALIRSEYQRFLTASSVELSRLERSILKPPIVDYPE